MQRKQQQQQPVSYWAVFTLRMSWWGEALVARMANRLLIRAFLIVY